MNIGREAAAALAHEVKNPLSLIKMNVDYIKSCLDKDFEDNFNVIEREIKKINALVTGLSFNRQPIYLKGLISAIISEYDISLKQKNITFAIEGGDGVFAMGDREKINILFFNLIKNSVEAIDKEGSIKVLISAENNAAKTVITDSGKGIAPSVLKNIGKPYNTDKEGGSGLGLAICTSIVNEHKGSIAFENTDKGCKVSVLLEKR